MHRAVRILIIIIVGLVVYQRSKFINKQTVHHPPAHVDCGICRFFKNTLAQMETSIVKGVTIIVRILALLRCIGKDRIIQSEENQQFFVYY